MKTVCMILLVACSGAARAELADPTRPPAAIYRAAASADGAAAAPAGPQLQSVLIAPGRTVAVIDGHTLRPGDRYQGAVLASVSATQVVLQRGAKRQVLQLAAASVAP